jgi:hypothetical protein
MPHVGRGNGEVRGGWVLFLCSVECSPLRQLNRWLRLRRRDALQGRKVVAPAQRSCVLIIGGITQKRGAVIRNMNETAARRLEMEGHK